MVGLAEQVVSQRLGATMVLLDAASGSYYELNESAADMLELWLQHDGDRAPVVAALSRRYQASPVELEADLAALLDELAAAGLVSRR